MKITHCTFTMYTGGAQILLVDILNGLYSYNEVSLIIVNNEWEDTILNRLNKNIKIYKIKRPRGSRNPYYIFKLNYLLKTINPDIVHCHEPNMADLFFFQSFKSILTIHDVGRQVANLQKYDKFVAISTSVAIDFKSRYDVVVSVVNNGIDFDSFHERLDYNIDTNKPFRLVQISRLIHNKKGQDILINALHFLKNNNLISNIHLDIVGDGESLDYLRNLTNENGLIDKIDFLGNKDRNWILNNLCNYHLLIQPSLYEGFGLTVIESVAAGVPVIASDIEGPAEILSILDYNFLFQVNNIESCAKKILEIKELFTEQKIKDVFLRAKIMIQQKYSIENTVDGYFKIYESSLQSFSND